MPRDEEYAKAVESGNEKKAERRHPLLAENIAHFDAPREFNAQILPQIKRKIRIFAP